MAPINDDQLSKTHKDSITTVGEGHNVLRIRNLQGQDHQQVDNPLNSMINSPSDQAAPINKDNTMVMMKALAMCQLEEQKQKQKQQKRISTAEKELERRLEDAKARLEESGEEDEEPRRVFLKVCYAVFADSGGKADARKGFERLYGWTKWRNSETWEGWEMVGLSADSGIGNSGKEGFVIKMRLAPYHRISHSCDFVLHCLWKIVIGCFGAAHEESSPFLVQNYLETLED